MTASWNYHNPVAVTFGWGSLAQLPKLLRGRRAVVVTFPQAAQAGLLSRLEGLLGKDLAGVIDDVQPNPELTWVSNTYRQFWQQYADCVVVAVGGGSVLDSAKMFLPGVASADFSEIHAALALSQSPTITRALEHQRQPCLRRVGDASCANGFTKSPCIAPRPQQPCASSCCFTCELDGGLGIFKHQNSAGTQHVV